MAVFASKLVIWSLTRASLSAILHLLWPVLLNTRSAICCIVLIFSHRRSTSVFHSWAPVVNDKTAVIGSTPHGKLIIAGFAHIFELELLTFWLQKKRETVGLRPCGRVPDLQSEDCRIESSHQTIFALSLPSSGVTKSVPAIAGKAKAGIAHSDCGWTVWVCR